MLNEWIKRGEVDAGQRGGVPTEQAEKMKALASAKKSGRAFLENSLSQFDIKTHCLEPE